MSALKTLFGQPSYVVENGELAAYVSVQGGHLTADFKAGGRTVSPFFVAPWWKEARIEGVDPILQVLRGDFFCFPFGENADAFEGREYPVHGKTCNENWQFRGCEEQNNGQELTLAMDLAPDSGTVEKLIRLTDGEPVIYQKHTIRGFDGSSSIGHHPILELPDREGAAIIDMTEPLAGFTTPVPTENPKLGGYSILQPNTEITDRSKVSCVDGGTYDLTRYPTPKGFEDIAIFISDSSRDFTFTAVSVPNEGYLYFQLKDPGVLASTLFWMSNGGRHMPPWSGRVCSTLGVEEITGYYHYGRKPSVEDNFLKRKGYKTCVHVAASEPFAVKLIIGLVLIERSFQGVDDIVRKDERTITIVGRGGEKMSVPCRLDWLT